MHWHFEQYNKNGIPRARKLRREMTDAERKLWRYLRNDQLETKIRRQVPIGSYVLDFYCPKAKLCIEIDGSQHFEDEGLKRDQVRDNYLTERGIDVLRISNYD
ncbi:MAG: endonuclease domain-containing protein, partial [Ignavibacteriales bacterium]|nr:endonuclease domain-containing protein [Ignavibacteriales bacterium]